MQILQHPYYRIRKYIYFLELEKKSRSSLRSSPIVLSSRIMSCGHGSRTILGSSEDSKYSLCWSGFAFKSRWRENFSEQNCDLFSRKQVTRFWCRGHRAHSATSVTCGVLGGLRSNQIKVCPFIQLSGSYFLLISFQLKKKNKQEITSLLKFLYTTQNSKHIKYRMHDLSGEDHKLH